MSTTILKFIPTIPSHVPDKVKQERAKELLSKIYVDNDIEAIVTDSVEFVDQGSNFESVACNHCGINLEMEAWQDLMENANETNFSDLTFTTNCCNKVSSLNDLVYNLPAGFSKFVLSVSDATTNINDVDFAELQSNLDTPIRIVWAHY